MTQVSLTNPTSSQPFQPLLWDLLIFLTVSFLRSETDCLNLSPINKILPSISHAPPQWGPASWTWARHRKGSVYYPMCTEEHLQPWGTKQVPVWVSCGLQELGTRRSQPCFSCSKRNKWQRYNSNNKQVALLWHQRGYPENTVNRPEDR